MSMRILIVDDNPINLKLASDVLEFEGFTLAGAENAPAALALLETFHPDLILMDISMPGMDGLTLTRRLKSNAATRDIPVVALTASAMKGDDVKARAAGCDGYITKPIDTRKFPAQIAEFVARSRSATRPDDAPP